MKKPSSLPKEEDCLIEKHLNDVDNSQRSGRWSVEEKLLFLNGLSKYGKGKWKKIGTLLPTRSLVQIKSHAQKVMKRLEAGEDVFAPLGANRDYFDMVVLPTALSNTIKGKQKKLPILLERTKRHGKNIVKVRKTVRIPVLGTDISEREANIHYNTIAQPANQSLPCQQRSIFQTTLGNRNGLSFSFGSQSPEEESFYYGDAYRVPPARTNLSESQSFPFRPRDMLFLQRQHEQQSRQHEQQLAAAALCQLSSLGNDQAKHPFSQREQAPPLLVTP